MEIKASVVLAGALLVLLHAVVPMGAVPGCYKGKGMKIKFTQFWIPKQHTQDIDENGHIILLDGALTKAVKGEDGKTIAIVDKNTYSKCVEEGICMIATSGSTVDTLVTQALTKTTFSRVNTTKFPFGHGAYETPLYPFTTVSADDLPRGTKLCVVDLVGLKLPNSLEQRHNGCVAVDDKFSNSEHCHISWFTGNFAFEYKLYEILPENLIATVCECTVAKYSTV